MKQTALWALAAFLLMPVGPELPRVGRRDHRDACRGDGNGRSRRSRDRRAGAGDDLRGTGTGHRRRLHGCDVRWADAGLQPRARCGRPTDRPWRVESYRVEELGWPLRVPLIGLVLGLLLALVFASGWIFLLSIAAGFAAGYSLRGETDVRLHLRRCSDHAFDTEYPSLRAFADLLIIRVGQKTIRRQFLEERHGVYRTTLYDDLGPPPAEPPSSTRRSRARCSLRRTSRATCRERQ